MSLAFKHHCERDPQPHFQTRELTELEFFSECGNYKIVHHWNSHNHPKRHTYSAFYKPKGWPNFGNHVDRSTPVYFSLSDAKAACIKHKQESIEGVEQ